jgi:hypothetical protein
MPESTYLQTILKSFATLDTGSLESNLRRDLTYQDTTAEIFLREMGRIFNMHKDSGDTHLILYEGKCGGTECPSCGKRGYRFVGNHTGNFMDLIFECEGDDITDIYSCEHFMSHEETIPLNFRHELEKQGLKVTFRGFIWIQGESDAGDENSARDYYLNLKQMIHDLRQNVLNEPNLKIILGVDEQHQFVKERPVVVEAQQRLAEEDVNIIYTSMLGLEKADGTHLTPAGLVEHGKRIFKSYLNLLSDS